MQHKTINYTYDQYVPGIFEVLCKNINVDSFYNFKYAIIPYFQENSYLNSVLGLEWYRKKVHEYVTEFKQHHCFKECEILNDPILLDFHLDELYSNGTLAKRFGAQNATPVQAGGEYEVATLKSIYTNYLLKNKEQLELLEQLELNHNPTVGGIRDTFRVLKYIYDQAHMYITPLDHIREYFGNIFREGLSDQCDLEKHIVIVPTNPTDEELLNLYERYPQYNDDSNQGYITLPDRSEYLYNSTNLPNEIRFIMCITKELFMKMIQQRMEHCKHRDLHLPETNRNPEMMNHYVPDAQLEALINGTLDYIIDCAEQFIKEKYSGTIAEKNLELFKQLRTSDYILLKFDHRMNLIY